MKEKQEAETSLLLFEILRNKIIIVDTYIYLGITEL